MSMMSEHAQAIADKLAIDEYGIIFRELPLSYQNKVFKRACEIANKQITELVSNGQNA